MTKIKSVLVVDDEILICDVIALQLEDQGYTVYDAFDGKEGLEKFKEHQPDLVLSDVRMPNMDGVEMMQEILKINPNARIVLLSGFTDHSEMDLQKKGAYDFISKPFDVKTINRLIDKLNP